MGAFWDLLRGEGGGGGFAFCSMLWAWGTAFAGLLSVVGGVAGGDPQIGALGMLAGGILAVGRPTRTLGALLAGVGALFCGAGGVASCGFVIALARVLGRPGIGLRGLQLCLIAVLLDSAVRVGGGDWSYSTGLLLVGGFWGATRVGALLLMAGAAIPAWFLGVGNLDIFCGATLLGAWMGRGERDRLRGMINKIASSPCFGWDFLSGQVGGWRTRVVVAAMGWAMYQNWLLLAGRNTMWEYATSAGPLCITVLYALGTSAIFLGCRPALMLAMAGAGLWHLLESWIDAHPQLNFTGEEYLVWFAFPAGMFILSILGRGMTSAGMDNLTGMFCRIMLFGSLGFAVLAKLNTDFFNPQVSCMLLAGDIPIWWKVAPGTGEIPAGLLVAAEAAPLILSFFSAPLAILATLGFAQGLAAIGPLGINACIIALTLGLLSDADLERIWRRRRLIACGVLLFAIFALPFSQLMYQGPRHWYQFAVFHTVCVVIGLGAAVAFFGRTQDMVAAWRAGGVSGIYREWVVGWNLDVKGVRLKWPFFAGLAVLLLFNGLCPYLGIKFRCSFSMLANLRVDHDRWNHFFMPRALLMTKHDPYVRIISVEDGHFSHPELAKRKKLEAGYMYSPEYFARACEARESDGQRTHLVVRWKGAQGVVDSGDMESFRAFVDGLPRRRNWGDEGLQEVLTFGNRPQHCTH